MASHKTPYESSGIFVPKDENNSGVWIAMLPGDVLEFDKFHVLTILNRTTERTVLAEFIAHYNATYEYLLAGKRLVSQKTLLAELPQKFADVKGFVFNKFTLRYYRDDKNGWELNLHYWSQPIRNNQTYLYDMTAIERWFWEKIESEEIKLRTKTSVGRPAKTERGTSSTKKRRKERPRVEWKPLSSISTDPLITHIKPTQENNESGNEKE